jgi:hypothetical protein
MIEHNIYGFLRQLPDVRREMIRLLPLSTEPTRTRHQTVAEYDAAN